MRIIFLIQRINNYRMFSTLIAEGLRRNIDIECWHFCNPEMKESGKGYLFPELSGSPFEKKRHPRLSLLPFNSLSEISHAVTSRNDITHIVSLSPPELIIDEHSLNTFKGYWCILMHGPDSFKEPGKLTETKINFNVKKIFFPYTQHFFEWGISFSKKFLPITKKYFYHKNTAIFPIGCPMFYNNLKQINTTTIRRKYNIPHNKKIVIYLPYACTKSKKNKKSRAWQTAFSYMHIKRKTSRRFNDKRNQKLSFQEYMLKFFSDIFRILQDRHARQYLFNEWNEPGVIKALKNFCDTNNLYLVVKPRRKFDFSEEVYKKADIIIDDDESQQYPSKLQELLSVASLTVGFFSTAVIESVFQEVPFINIETLDERFLEPQQQHWHPNYKGSLYSYEGVVWNYSISDFIREIPTKKTSDFTVISNKRDEYKKMYTTTTTTSASKSFFNYITNTQRT
ncbi:hypothetical protein OO185_04095 [Prosthecochloris sp. SCSIO W1102]|uniref:hypothetical protein n=1 Tax=Prosthecochloris sp. SCSIO W1102 TaxID=2992243 RepID=UPI00223E8DE0|nr:hypothetical protein [Prosthecochloris sp. SCSIO W1102]UZJ39121.1 hypothetical protein OO185_04095 [Prosthecochloris sp. SCSIO W1102]